MTVTIKAGSTAELQQVLAALEDFKVENLQVDAPLRDADMITAFNIVEGNGNAEDFWSGAGIWEDDDRSIEEIRKNAWNRNETYL